MRKAIVILFMTLALSSAFAQAAGDDSSLRPLMETPDKQYTVVKGDWLQNIAQTMYGDYRLWPALWWANKEVVKNPERIEVGDKLTVYKLPFEAGSYYSADNLLMTEAYLAAYSRLVELGPKWTDARRWVLTEALFFEEELFASRQNRIDPADLAWYEKKIGTKIEPVPVPEAPIPMDLTPVVVEETTTTTVAPEPVAETTTTTVAPAETAEVVEPAPIPVAPDEEPTKTATITFIETSDVHGAIFPYNFITAKPMKASLAQVAALVAGERSDSSRDVVLLDDGDALQGQPTVYYYNFEKTDVPHIWSEAVNYLDYEALGVGNHDIETGHVVYDKLFADIKASVLCANAVKEDGEPYFTPYKVIERQGVKIAILGMITPRIPDWLPPQFWTGISFVDMVEAAKKWVPIIMENEKPDLLVGLFHSGVDYAYGGMNKDTPNNENASQLVAEQVPGFDMIFAGHDHMGWDGMGWDPAKKAKAEVKDPNGKTVYIYGSLAAASKVPVVTVMLDWDKTAEKWNKRIRGGLISLEGVEPDPDFLAKFQPAFDEVKAWVDRPIGKMEGSVSSRDSMFGDSAFVDLIHRIQLELAANPETGLKPADVSFAAPLSFDAMIPTSEDGTLYVRDMFNLYQYENFLYTMEMTGQQIKDFLEYSYGLWFDTMPNEGNHLIAFQKDKEGKLITDARSGAYQTKTRSYNYDSAAGIYYTVDVSKPVGERITISAMATGSIFDLESTYTVAINSYRGQGGGGHLTTGAGLDKAAVQKLQFVNGTTTKDLRYYLLKWFETQQETVTVGEIGNWSVIPEDLAAEGKANDFPLLYK